jgi:hypothetical protein
MRNVFIFLFFFNILSFVAQPDSETMINDPQDRFTIQLGSGWTPLPLQQTGVIARYRYGENILDQLVVRSEALPRALSPLQYAQTIEQKELSGGPQYQKHQEKNVNLSGQEAAYQQFSFVVNTPQGKTSLIGEMYYFVIQNTGYVIAFSARESEYNTLKPIFDQVLQSIRYKKLSL